MIVRLAWCALIAAIAPSIACAEKENHLTVYAGYLVGGNLTDVNSGNKWEFSDGGAYALAAGFGLSRTTQIEVFASQRKSSLKTSGASGSIGMDVLYFHAGGTAFFDAIGSGWYVAGGMGATHLQPADAGLNPETRPSLNLGFGYMLPLGRHFGLKIEARGYATLVNSNGGLFCSGGCVVQIKGDTFTQAEVLAGFAARF